ncbi:MAG: hypothetical protein K1W31_17100, partial [Lachnospiraceae bacterium]
MQSWVSAQVLASAPVPVQVRSAAPALSAPSGFPAAPDWSVPSDSQAAPDWSAPSDFPATGDWAAWSAVAADGGFGGGAEFEVEE